MTLRKHLISHSRISNIAGLELLLLIALFFTNSNVGFILLVITFFTFLATLISILIYRYRICKIYGKPAKRFFYKSVRKSSGISSVNQITESNYANKSIVTDPSNSHIAGNIYYHGI